LAVYTDEFCQTYRKFDERTGNTGSSATAGKNTADTCSAARAADTYSAASTTVSAAATAATAILQCSGSAAYVSGASRFFKSKHYARK